jgi:glycosyltransferase involved in cell wall biosynthesis
MTTMFLRQAIRSPEEFQWSFAVSAEVYRELSRFESRLPEFEVFEGSPARDLASRRRLREVEQKHRPDLVFTVSGPAYVEFRARHVLVCAEPWVTHAGLTAFRALRFPDEWLRVLLRTRYKAAWFRKATAWILQTDTARRGFIERLGVPAERCYVIPATCDAQYRSETAGISFPSQTDKLRLLCFTAYYKHKNLGLIPYVARRLDRLLNGRPFEFVFTLPPEHKSWRSLKSRAQRLRTKDRLVTLGPIAVNDGPALYRSCHICFLPTVLEMFSATYPEAMAMGMPIVTSNLDFAQDICRDAAVYFAPRNEDEAAERIFELINDRNQWETLVSRGYRRLAQLPTPEEQYQRDLQCFREVLAMS